MSSHEIGKIRIIYFANTRCVNSANYGVQLPLCRVEAIRSQEYGKIANIDEALAVAVDSLEASVGCEVEANLEFPFKEV